MHVFTYTFGFANGQIALVFGVLFVMALLAQPVWVLIANKYDKRRALIACLWINIAVSVLFVVCVLASAWITDHYLTVMPLAVLIGFSMGGSIALPYSMISDTIDKDAYESGTRKEGVFYGCATFLYKISQSLAVFFVGTLLDFIKFDSSVVQEPTVYLKLGLILPAGFLVCFTLALIFTGKYTLTREKVIEYQRRCSIALNELKLQAEIALHVVAVAHHNAVHTRLFHKLPAEHRAEHDHIRLFLRQTGDCSRSRLVCSSAWLPAASPFQC